MPEQFEQVRVNLTNDKVRFTGVSPSNPDHPVTFDFAPPIGDGQGYNGLELLLMSFAGCSGTTIVYLLRNMGKKVAGLEVQAKGLRRQKPPIKFEKIFLKFRLVSEDAAEADLGKSIQLAENAYCPVWQMIRNNTEVIPEYEVCVPE